MVPHCEVALQKSRFLGSASGLRRRTCLPANSNSRAVYGSRIAPISAMARSIAAAAQSVAATPPAAAQSADSPAASAGEASASHVKNPTWRASIDFKWIKEHQADVEENTKHRKSTADVAKVIALSRRVRHQEYGARTALIFTF